MHIQQAGERDEEEFRKPVETTWARHQLLGRGTRDISNTTLVLCKGGRKLVVVKFALPFWENIGKTSVTYYS